MLASAWAVCLHGHALAQPATAILTLRQAVSEALAKNDRMLDHADAESQANLDLRLARSAFGIKATPNVFGSFGQTDVASQNYRVDVSQRYATGTEMRVSVGTTTSQIPSLDGSGDLRFYNADTTLLLTQPLLRGFGRTVTRRALAGAELRHGAVERQGAVVRRQVAIDTAAAYYQLVGQHAFVGVARASVDRSRAMHDAAEAKLVAGLVSQLDVLRARQLRIDAEHQLADAVAALDESRDALATLMGREPGQTFTVAAQIPTVEGEVDAEHAVATALALRVDLQNLAAVVDDANTRVAASRNAQLPQVDLNVAMTRRQTASGFLDSFGRDGFKLATFFTVGMPSDRTAQAVDFQQAVLERSRRARERATLARTISADVRRNVRERQRLARAVAAAEASVALSRQEVEVAQARYERGLSNNLDLVAAEGQLLAAEGRRLGALAQAAVQDLRLRAAMEVLDPDDVGDAPADRREGVK